MEAFELFSHQKISTSSIVFPLLGKFFLTGGYGGIYVYTAELFPTVMRYYILGPDFPRKFTENFKKCWYWILLSCRPYWWYHGSSYFHVGCCQSSIAVHYFWLFRNFWCFLRILSARSTRSNSPWLCRRGDYRFLLLQFLILIIRAKNLVRENHQHWKISREWLLVCSEQQKQQGNITKSANNKPHVTIRIWSSSQLKVRHVIRSSQKAMTIILVLFSVK